MEYAQYAAKARRLARPGKWALIVLTVYFVAGFLILPSVVKSMLVKKLSEKLERRVEITSIEVNPFALSVTVDGFKVKTEDGQSDAISFEQLYVNAELMSLFRRAPVVHEVRLVKPYANVVRYKDGSYSFSYLMKGEKKKEEKKKPSSPPVRFSVNNISIVDGNVEFSDMPMGKVHHVRDLTFAVPFVSNIGFHGESFVQPAFSAVVNGTPVVLKGKTKPFADSLETSFDINVEKFDLPRYFAYVPVKTQVGIPSGKLDLNLVLTYVQFKNGKDPSIGVRGGISLKNFALSGPDGKRHVELPLLEVGISSSDMAARKVSLSKILLDSPKLDIARDPDGKINLVKYLTIEKEEEPEEEEKEPFYAELDFFKLANGSVTFTDHMTRQPFTFRIKPVDVLMVNLKTIKGWKTQMSVDMKTDAGEIIDVDSQVGIDPVSASGTLKVSGVPLKRYTPYFPETLLVDILDGSLGISTRFSYSKDETVPATRLDELEVNVNSLSIAKKGEPGELVSVPEFALAASSVDLLTHDVLLGSIRTTGGRIKLVRAKDGKINLATLTRPGAPSRSAKKPAEKPDAKPWTVTVADASAVKYALDFTDNAAPKPVRVSITDAALTAKGITTRKGEAGEVTAALSIGKRGRFTTSGKAVVDPPSANLAIRLKDLDVHALSPYYADKLPMILTKAFFSANGRAEYAAGGKDGPAVKYAGEMSITELDSVDKAAAEELVNWKSLYVTGMNVGYNPTFVDIKKVALTDFFIKAIVNADRSLNLTGPKKEPPAGEAEAGAKDKAAPAPAAPAAEPAAAAKKEKPVKVNVEAITLQGGTLDFLDRSVSPNFKVDLTKIGGKINGISSMETKYAEVDLRAVYDKFAPVEITGKIQPLRENLFVDLKADLTDVELSPLTPYSGKFLGYTIARGKLNMDLSYKIENKKLEAQNKIFIDQFYLGDKVDSPDATSLPVKLALALLRDRKGEIHLDVPLSGSTDDPEFSYGGIILQIIWNILTKAATSPFALLGAIFGGGEDLGYVEFDYGSSAVSEAAKLKLETLSKSLVERPELKMAIEGHADVEKDRTALRQIFFDRKVKAQKLKVMVDEGVPAVPVDDVVVAPEEYEEYLREAYSDEDFPKPRNIIGLAKKLPVEEMEKLMLANLEVTDDQLTRLGAERAENVKTVIMGFGQVEPTRVFIGQPKTIAPEKKEGVRDSRVVFVLE